MKKIDIFEGTVQLVFYVADDGRVAFVHCGAGTYGGGEPDEATFPTLSPVEIASSDSGFNVHHGSKKLCGTLSGELRFDRIEDRYENGNRAIALHLTCPRTDVCCRYVLIPTPFGTALSTCVEVVARSEVALDYVSAFRFAGLFPPHDERAYDRITAYIPHNTWHGEGQWRQATLAELGLNGCHGAGVNLKTIVYGNTGSWSSKNYLPAGILRDGDACMMWQTETNGSWTTEIGQTDMRPYLAVSGPTLSENFWEKRLRAGDRLSTPTVVLAFGTFNDCIAQLTAVRRAQAVAYRNDAELPSQYNGYMHANWDFPTTENLYKQMDVCAELGIKTFVVDAGWFCRGCFWNTLGDWTHPQEPFGDTSFADIIARCHSLGMRAGLWLELEDVGIECPIVNEVDSLLMRRNGVRVCENRRYFFDFSLPETRAYMDSVVDTVVDRYGVDYVKLDYNCDCGVGCDSPNGTWGEGLAAHTQGWIDWIRHWHMRRPELVLEGCASGGMRLDHLTLSAFALGNTSDQVLYNRTPYIAANLAAYLVPERMGVWSYPLADQTVEQIDVNMINAMLFRLQLAGQVYALGAKQLEHVREGIACYDALTPFKKTAVPFLPLGFCKFFDDTVSFGLRGNGRLVLAVYRLGGEATKHIPLEGLHPVSVATVYPADTSAKARLVGDALEVVFDKPEQAVLLDVGCSVE